MSGIKSRHTLPEMLVRKCLRKLNVRFRGNVRKFPGSPDFVIQGSKKAIFVNGCFWHGHKGCGRAARPESNKSFWNKKIDLNIERDRRNLRLLKNDGWQVLVIWQCQMKYENNVVRRIIRFIKKEALWVHEIN
ncbi:MAG: DNA mismatch endonuclease Vsr [Chitinivibrionales bacterium]|nr:DNA mismatch endonuclease Vsr [Chitinivibrionales bacterium]